MLQRIPIKPGEGYLVPAGTPHAIGPGVFLLEVQEPTDLTISVEYSFAGRQRAPEQLFLGMGFERGMRCFDYRAAGAEVLGRCASRPRPLRWTDTGREDAIIDTTNTTNTTNTPCFRVSRLRVTNGYRWSRREEPCVAVIIQGAGQLSWPGGTCTAQRGEAFFLPAAYVDLAVQSDESDLVLLACHPPEA
jgi:mannose-6-phosphate isomerase